YDGRRYGHGDLHALPKDIGPQAMFINQDLFQRLHEPPPSPRTPLTWSQALALWQRLTRDENHDGRTDLWGVYGFPLEAAVWSHGGEFLSADARRFTMAADPLALEALQWTADLQAVHRVAPQERQREALPVDAMFLTGRLACFIGGRWMVPLFRQAPFNWDVAPIPVSDRTRRPAGWSGSVGLAMAPECRHPEAAWQLIEFLAGPEGQAAQARMGFQIPNQRPLAWTDVFLQRAQRPAHAEVFAEAALYQQPNPSTRTPDNEWWTLLHQRLAPVYRGEVRAAERLHAIVPEVQAALDRGWRLLEAGR
ncbi:MAG: extracellular solute-binding protein, partial [Armatimonadetes bacterium]|nr:extracellular solute-binding protein [Armatimonadota bacterium]